MFRAWWTIIISIIMIIAGCGLIIGYRPATSINANEVCNNWSYMSGTFGSYSDGETVEIFDVIGDIKHMDTHWLSGDPVDWTIIAFASAEIEKADMTKLYNDPTKIWGLIIFQGDLTKSFKVGDKVEVKVRVVEFEFMSETGEILDWYEEHVLANIAPESLEKDSFGELRVGDPEDITHANMTPEILFVSMIIIGLLIMLIGIIKVQKAKKLAEKTSRATFFKDRGDKHSYDEKAEEDYQSVTPLSITPKSRPLSYSDDNRYPEPPTDDRPDAGKEYEENIRDDSYNRYYSTEAPKRPRPPHAPPRYRVSVPAEEEAISDSDDTVTFKRVSRPIRYDKYYSDQRTRARPTRDSVRNYPAQSPPPPPPPPPQSSKPIHRTRTSRPSSTDDRNEYSEDDVIFKPVSRPMRHQDYYSAMEPKHPIRRTKKGPVKSDYLGKRRSKPTKSQDSARNEDITWDFQKTRGRDYDLDEFDDADEVAPLEIYPDPGIKKKPKSKILCPKCGNTMYVTIPYRPFEFNCDNCGTLGIIR